MATSSPGSGDRAVHELESFDPADGTPGQLKESVELWPDVHMPLASYLRVRALLEVLLVVLGLFVVDRLFPLSGWDPVGRLTRRDTGRNGSPLAVAAAQAVEPAPQVEYLKRFAAARSRTTDLLDYSTIVAPPALRLAHLRVVETGSNGRSDPDTSLRVEGVMPGAGDLKGYLETLRVMAPALQLERWSERGDGGVDGVVFWACTGGRMAVDRRPGDGRPEGDRG